MADGSARPRVLFVTRNFPPLLGGMERLNWHLADELRQHCELRVVAPEGAARLAPPGVEVREVCLRPLHRFLVQAALRARHEARAWRPDWVLAGSGLTATLAWGAARASGARAAAYVHGLDLSVAHPVYRALWRPALRRMDRIIANSSATARLAGALGIDASRISIVHPGTELPEFDERARERFRQAHRIDPRAPVLLAVGRLTERKGLRQFVADVLPRIVREHPGAVFVVIGDAPANALYAQVQSPESIVQAGRDAGVDGNLRMLGKVDERELHDADFAADLHVFPIRELPDDIEGFGMVAVEAAAHGLPTVAYACGGVVDAVAHGISGVLIQAGDGGGFAGAVLAGLERPLCQAATRGFAEGFSWEHFGAQVLRALGQDDAI